MTAVCLELGLVTTREQQKGSTCFIMCGVATQPAGGCTSPRCAFQSTWPQTATRFASRGFGGKKRNAQKAAQTVRGARGAVVAVVVVMVVVMVVVVVVVVAVLKVLELGLT